MATLAAVALGLLSFAAVEQIIAVVIFLVHCRRQQKALAGDEPAVMVILPVRGADETLGRCVTALLHQAYENFRVRIIFDSHTDPGWKIVDSILESHPDAPIELLQLGNPRPTCSLKCSAVYEATEDLGDCEVVALVDSDIVPHETWLRELVAPLADQRVGVANGNRWYLPVESNLGSLVRYCWNAVAVVTMHLWQMPWGGTMAIKRSVLEESDIRERWIRAGCEDVPLGAAVQQLKLKSRFVPSLMLKDRESVTVSNCLPFLDRQLLWARLYHPACWWTSNVWQVLVSVTLVCSAFSLLFGIFSGQLLTAAFGALGLIVYGVVAFVLLRMVERQLVPEEQGPMTAQPLRVFFAIIASQLLMVRVIFVSLLTKNISWRGIDYRIGGPWNIEMVEYRPYASGAPTNVAGDLHEAAPVVTPDGQTAPL